MDIEMTLRELMETYKGIVKAIHDGNSCLSLEAQWLIKDLIANGIRLADEYDFEEILDSKTEIHDSIMFLSEFKGVGNAK